MIPEHLVFIDLETTGTNTLHDRITEVGFYEVKKGTVVKEWSSLINPGKNISPFIEQITGITTAMVADAPKFSDIADELSEKLAGKVLVEEAGGKIIFYEMSQNGRVYDSIAPVKKLDPKHYNPDERTLGFVAANEKLAEQIMNMLISLQ